MTHFVTGCGRSGSMWLAQALHEAAGLDAGHETWPGWEDGVQWPAVEVNTYLWADVLDIKAAYPKSHVFHLVRDGRDVVRSLLDRPQHDYSVRTACRIWAGRVGVLKARVPCRDTYRLETILGDWRRFHELAQRLGAGAVSHDAWNALRVRPVNATEQPSRPFAAWPHRDRNVFWTICGEMMQKLGYTE